MELYDQIPIEIIDENEYFVVVNKPENLNFHDEGEFDNGLFNRVKRQLSLNELYPVHRLDKMTSGLVIFAKDLATAQRFQSLFSEHKVEKYYLAISDKKPKKKQGMIKGDMQKSRRGSWKLLRSTKSPAISQFFSFSIDNGLRAFLVKPYTGKTHQIRVALSSIGSPICGDTYYHSLDNTDRGYLHAYAIGFELNGQNYRYKKAPSNGALFLKDSFSQLMEKINEPWSLNWPRL